MASKAGHGERDNRGNQRQSGSDKNKDQRSSQTPQRKPSEDNRGGNDPDRENDAGRKGGRN